MSMQLRKLNFNFSNQCFVLCNGCYHNFRKGEIISTREIIDFIRFARIKGIEKITFSGGDPLARQDIFTILEESLNLGYIVNLDTVGTPFITPCKTKQGKVKVEKITNFEIFRKIEYLGIPIDGDNEHTQVVFRKGRNDFLNEQLKILSILEEEQVRVCINTVCHNYNYKHLSKMFDMIAKFKNVKKWQVFEFMNIGPGGARKNDMSLGREERVKTLNLLSDLKKLQGKIDIEYKSANSRSGGYMLIDATGSAYKMSSSNEEFNYGNIKNKDSWEHILLNTLE